MKINNLIGVSGYINNGKDLVGEMLMYIGETLDRNPTYWGFVEHEKYKNHKYSIDEVQTYEIRKCADKLKDIVAIVIGCSRAQLEDEIFKNTPLGPEWERWRLETCYAPHPEYSDSNEHYDDIEYHASEIEAKKSLKDQLIIYGTDCFSGHITKEVLTPRKILQLLGTQGGRMKVHPNIWVNSLFADYKQIGSPLVVRAKGLEPLYPKWIITDVRFPGNEGTAVTKHGGLLIGVRRKFAIRFPKYAHLRCLDRNRLYEDEYAVPRKLRDVDVELYKSLTHDSESSMEDHSWCDVVIENNGTLEELFDKVLDAVTTKIEV